MDYMEMQPSPRTYQAIPRKPVRRSVYAARHPAHPRNDRSESGLLGEWETGRLQQHRWRKLMFGSILILVLTLFAVLGLLTVMLHGQGESEWGNMLIKILLVASICPISRDTEAAQKSKVLTIALSTGSISLADSFCHDRQ